MNDLERIEAELELERRVTDPTWANKAKQRRNAEEAARRQQDVESTRSILAAAAGSPETQKQVATAKASLARFEADERSMAALLNRNSPTHQVAQDTYTRLIEASVADLPDSQAGADLIEDMRRHARKQRAYARR